MPNVENSTSTARDTIQNSVNNVRNAAQSALSSAEEKLRSSSFGAKEVNVGAGERLLSIAAGTALFGYGLFRRGLVGYGSIVVGSALLNRGFRGYCSVNALLGRNSAETAERALKVADALAG